jgi:hypothetical protein
MSRRQNHDWTAEHDARLRALYAEGRSWAETGAAFGVTSVNAKARGRRIGLDPRAPRGAATQQPREAATGPVLPHLDILARSKPPQRSEGGHPLPAGDPLSWALLLSHTPVLGNPAWPGERKRLST